MKPLSIVSSAAFSPALRAQPSPHDLPRTIAAEGAGADPLSRNVFGLLGIPVDAVSFPALLQSIQHAVYDGSPFLISTPNVNFLVKSQESSAFRESLLSSNLCLVDGMPLIWIARLLGIPLPERIAGADLFSRLKSVMTSRRPLRVFLLGGADGVAAHVGDKLNAEQCGLECVGALNPGYGAVEEISTNAVLDRINASAADMVAVFFGAEKAQAWLMHNAKRLQAPIRAQFGATINFEAGRVKRAPHFMRNAGLEWLWRIKEEPYLWRRYFNDGRVLVSLLATSVLPLLLDSLFRSQSSRGLTVLVEEAAEVTVRLQGDATAIHAGHAIRQFRKALATGKSLSIDLSEVRRIDCRFFGLLLSLRQTANEQGRQFSLSGISPRIRRIFRVNRFEFLLTKV